MKLFLFNRVFFFIPFYPSGPAIILRTRHLFTFHPGNLTND